MGYSEPTRLRLAALSGNECAFPGCVAPIFDTDYVVMVGEVCHIKGKKPGSARYDLSMTDDERDAFENLMLMCSTHHDIIDKPTTRDAFPAEMLLGYKRDHESRFQNTVVKEDALKKFTELLSNLQPVRSEVVLTPVTEWLLTKPDDQMGLDYYDFRVALRNDGSKTVRDYRVDVEIPKRYMQNAGSYQARVDTSKPDVWLFRHHLKDSMPPHEIHQGDTRAVFHLSYVIAKQHYFQGITEAVTVRVYSGDEIVTTENYPIAEMLNAERVEVILGPRLAALKKIYQTARAFYGDEGDLTDSPIFLSEEPAEGKRNVYIKNAYDVAKGLVKEGWLVFENENALIVKLTDAGIRKAS
jgi:hypothetical protein